MSQTILLADDSVTIRKVVELTFMDESFDLISVGSGTDALERFGAEVDLVIADVHMPGPDGYEVCKEVKQRSPGTPVLLLVGTFESYDEGRAADVGADDCLKKPFDSQDLLSRVHDLLAGSGGCAAEDQPVPAALDAVSESGAAEAVAAPPAAAELAAGDPAAPEAFHEGPGLAVSDREAAPQADHDADAGAIRGVEESPKAVAELSEESVDRIARRVVELLSEDFIRQVAWEVIPDLAEVVIKERLNELESQVE